MNCMFISSLCEYQVLMCSNQLHPNTAMNNAQCQRHTIDIHHELYCWENTTSNILCAPRSYRLLSWISQRSHRNPLEFPICLQAYGSRSKTRGHLWDFLLRRSPKTGIVWVLTIYNSIPFIRDWLTDWLLIAMLDFKAVIGTLQNT